MEKKIEKIEGAYDLPVIKKKLNQVIDHLNSQVQPEEIDNTKLVMPPSAYDQAEKEGFNMKNKVKSKLLPQDTPEEWEEELGKLMSTWGKVLLVNKGRIGAGMQTAMYLKFYHFIKNLLSERERWAIDTFLKDTASYNSFHNGRPRTMRNGLSGEGFEVRVSKLSKKK